MKGKDRGSSILLPENPFSDPIFRLKIAHSVQDVASALGLDSAKLFYVIRHCDDGRYYKKFKIPKKSGGFRDISRPIRGLAMAQDRLATILTAHYKPKSFVKGYVKGESFLSNAQYHERQKWVMNIDIEDFFPSIGFARVRGLFLSSYFGFNSNVSTILARITTFNNQLPQGASTSPILANILANNLDKGILSTAIRGRLRYSRYADDITISSSQRHVPSLIVKNWEPDKGKREIRVGNDIVDAFKKAHFKINEKKTRIQFTYERQEVTGLVVNKKANVWRKDVSKIRMKLHSAKKYGAENAAKLWLGKDKSGKDFWIHIEGWLAYIRQVRGVDDPVLAKLCKQAILSGLKASKWIQRCSDMVREFDVFLSHASEDKEKVRILKNALEIRGIKVFFDEDSIEWGDSIVEKINHGLLKSSFFIPILSDKFSKKGWTNKELNSAIHININRKGRILPIAINGFSIAENYPLLNETLYKVWPNNEIEQNIFIEEVSDQLLLKIQKTHSESAGLG
ncbi:hypothetical protein B5M44_14705 [Shinella sumterensis]|jgi:RNA-directed DNA polymerase|uniref:TIR domain-containing anti-phage reverse transcriptase n=1 Tax=Shinella sumterensis TaxID=1967501 RepID=UPI00106E6847|nr:TIR domain-containing anti-phage reverse transcriptase [Shinella sumterensis]MCD1263552.1 TIR domain-containing protein [Shinella sumterensis]TFE97540.1 hypothetical protein B5M44_14705 [Shinella sumterensis]